MTRGWAALRTALATLALGGLAVAQASASEMTTETDTPKGISNLVSYSTSGQIDPTLGVSGANVISFDSIKFDPSLTAAESAGNGTVMTPSTFSMGSFIVGALPEGQTTTYTDTPFSITYLAHTVNGDELMPNETPLVLKGVLNGTVAGGSQSDLIASFLDADDASTTGIDESIRNFRTGDFVNTLKILSDKVALVPSTSHGGETTLQGQIVSRAQPIPEPTTIAFFLTAAAGLGLRRRLRKAA